MINQRKQLLSKNYSSTVIAVLICSCLEGSVGLLKQACPLPLVTPSFYKENIDWSPFRRGHDSPHVWHLSSSLFTWEPKVEGMNWWNWYFPSSSMPSSPLLSLPSAISSSRNSPRAELAQFRRNRVDSGTGSSVFPVAQNTASGAGKMNDERAFSSTGFTRGPSW